MKKWVGWAVNQLIKLTWPYIIVWVITCNVFLKLIFYTSDNQPNQ